MESWTATRVQASVGSGQPGGIAHDGGGDTWHRPVTGLASVLTRVGLGSGLCGATANEPGRKAAGPHKSIGKERKGHGPALRIRPKGLLGVEIPFYFCWFIFKIKFKQFLNEFIT
jgi:hypothetical protein